ncbi:MULTISPECIES: transglycosylase domain-containing protein [Cryobacterium]|uniref:Penicillin-binding protein n=1 Tax=Cryobacterium shii TaxID=1259235 RepID=A0AAQ2HEP8_9MICO|nr:MULTISPECIES: transglycosylase domain-containing protein [Cryobacterium]TFC43822.1 penicillin-binding protein [Cryobacterium shii]TFD17145.1 penicillin-binding protein [Cryobacterium sp. TMT4-10]
MSTETTPSTSPRSASRRSGRRSRRRTRTLIAMGVVVAIVGAVAITVMVTLPDNLSIGRLSQKSNVYATANDGSPVLLASFYDQNRVEVASAAISPFVKDAATSGEDPGFYAHGGVDIWGSVTGLVSTLVTGTARGGSSITQQYVKNVLVQKCETLADQAKRTACYDAATETSASRKLTEMSLAIGLEKRYSKADILRQYLNITGFGGSIYGIESAANYYFNTTAAALTLPQAASLVAIVNNPVKFQLDKPDSETNGAANGYAANKDRRDYILDEMLAHEKISKADRDAAVAAPVEPAITEPSTGCQTAGGSAYFCDLVVQTLRDDPAFGKTAAERAANFRLGGYKVFTTLDLDLQATAEATLAENVPKTFDGWDVGGVISSVAVGTGRVLAMAQNKDYSQDPAATGANFTAVNYNTDLNRGGSNGFQPGSTYKVFTLAEWLKAGNTLGDTVNSRERSDWGEFQDSCNGPQDYGYSFAPGNDSSNDNDSYYSALESTVGSINTGYIGMAKELDLCNIRKTAEAFGIHRADGNPLEQGASSVLGTNEIAPLTMAAAYAGIANNGVTCTPVVIDKIVGPDGTEIAAPKSACTASVAPEIAAGMTYAMQRVLTGGTATASYRATSPRVPMIGKTGTTDDNLDTWMSGASTKVATVVGVVNVSGEGEDQRETYFDNGQAATARHRMWPDMMSVANEKFGGDAFTLPPRSMTR